MNLSNLSTGTALQIWSTYAIYDELATLPLMPKRVTNPGSRWSVKPGHRQRNHHVIGERERMHFTVYLRQKLLDENDFSCGIAYTPPGGARLTLARYNEPSHVHGEIAYRPHIPITKESAIEAGRKPESKAVETDRFATLNGVLRCLIGDYHLSGTARPDLDQPRLMP